MRIVWRWPGQYLLNWTAGELRGVAVHADEIENGGNKTEAIVGFLHLLMAGYASVGAARKEKYGVRRDAQERPVIAARIEITDVKIPMIVGEDQEVRLGQASTALVEARQYRCVQVVGVLRKQWR